MTPEEKENALRAQARRCAEEIAKAMSVKPNAVCPHPSQALREGKADGCQPGEICQCYWPHEWAVWSGIMKERGMIFNGESEIWKPVVGYEGRYEVSNFGNIRSLSNYRKGLFHNNIAHFIQNKGYHYVSIRDASGKSKRLAVHRIVLEAFVGPRPDGKQIAHWNGDPSDNRVENLRWATSKENIADRSRHGRTAIGENAGSAKLDRKAVKTIKRLNNLGLSACEVAHLACVNPSTIISIWQGESWKHV